MIDLLWKEITLGCLFKVVQGMEYLSNHRFVHRDLACRNVLLSPNFEAKITSLSLNNDAFVQDYYTYRHISLPLRYVSDVVRTKFWWF